MVQQFVVGRIGTPQIKKQVYWWPVTYTDETEISYECEDLVGLIVRSRRLSLDVTGSELPSIAEQSAMQREAALLNDTTTTSDSDSDDSMDDEEVKVRRKWKRTVREWRRPAYIILF